VREIGAFDAKAKLGQLLDWVEAGEDVIITRRGRPAARLTSPSANFDRERARAAATRIKQRRKGQRLDGLSISELINRSGS
jgi:prevent-host-death family protein